MKMLRALGVGKMHISVRSGQAVRALFAAVLVVLAVFASGLLPVQPALAVGGGLRLVSADYSGAEYDAIRIADEDGLPLDQAFDWPSLSGEAIPGGGVYPVYDPSSSHADADGRKLVEAVSASLAKDEDGSLAAELSTFVTPKGESLAVQVVADGPTVSVENGWWLLISPGKRPLFAWVDGAPVTLGDKSDVPTLEKEYNDKGEWTDAGSYGPTQDMEYRLVLTVPQTYDQYSTYWCEFHDEWDGHLQLKKETMRLVLRSHETGSETDVSSLMDVTSDATSFTARIENLCASSAVPGDALILSYSMSADPAFNPGSEGLLNTAWATFPQFDGKGETPKDHTRVYTVSMRVRKASTGGSPLAGAVFAIRNADGQWLAADGTFGVEQARAEFKTELDGVARVSPVLAPGTYTLIELSAPEGYVLPSNPETTFTISTDEQFDHLDLTVHAKGLASLASVDASSASFDLEVVNEKGETPPPFNPLENLPQTWDSLAPLQKVGVLALIASACALALSKEARRHKDKNAG